jgi:hypothetical protein
MLYCYFILFLNTWGFEALDLASHWLCYVFFFWIEGGLKHWILHYIGYVMFFIYFLIYKEDRSIRCSIMFVIFLFLFLFFLF